MMLSHEELASCSKPAGRRSNRQDHTNASINNAPSSFMATAITSATSVTMIVLCNRASIPSERAISRSKNSVVIVLKRIDTYARTATVSAASTARSEGSSANGLPHINSSVSWQERRRHASATKPCPGEYHQRGARHAQIHLPSFGKIYQ